MVGSVLFYASLLDSENDKNYEKGGRLPPKTPTAPQRPWRSSHSAVLAMATNLNLNDYQIFVGSLRATGYDGHIILGIRPDTSSDIIEYLEMQNVTMYRFYKADKCTYDGYLNNEGKPLDMTNWQCPKEYPDYKITHARFVLYKDWLVGCEGCTDGIMLTDARDSFFQADPFQTAVKLGLQYPILVFEEIVDCPTGLTCDEPRLDNTHWLTDFPVKVRGSSANDDGNELLLFYFYILPFFFASFLIKIAAIIHGSTMGSREGILEYLTAMREEFDYWKSREECRIDIIGDDQSIHNYLYYTNRLKNARAVPHRTGPIHVVGYQAARIDEKLGGKDAKKEDDAWQRWLPEEYGLINQETGMIVENLGRTPSTGFINMIGSVIIL
ncbi:hypothetical protein ACHAW5_010236 [Stephanodiscus triporus]|uniref:Uncharacterized protein n=1 Tax=Stephanodiscus triporus TaxID=2934178 RepID=A0ABD3MN99_9STRA